MSRKREREDDEKSSRKVGGPFDDGLLDTGVDHPLGTMQCQENPSLGVFPF
jgi:hypothetical protein